MNHVTSITAAPHPAASFAHAPDPVVSVVIVTYGTGEVLFESLASLAASLTADEPPTEVTVIDQLHPSLGHWTADQLSLRTSGLKLVRLGANLGFGGGNDLGVDLARGSVIALLNPDAIVPTGWLRPLVETVHEDPMRIAAPALTDDSGDITEAGVTLDVRGLTTPVTSPAPGSVRPDFASAACWVLARTLYDSLGGFDPIYHPAYHEDVDFALRAERVGGGTTIVPTVRVVHRGGASTDRDDGAMPDSAPQRALFVDRWPRRLAR